MKNYKKKQLINFKLHIILCNMTELCADLLCSTWEMNHFFVQHIHAVCATILLIAH